MGLGIFPSFKPALTDTIFDSDGTRIADEFQRLDEIAVVVGAMPLSSFGDNRAVPEDFDGDPDELDQLLGDWDEWFSASEGLRTIRGLIQAIRDDAPGAQDFESKDNLLVELGELARCLDTAVAQQAQFRLEIG